MNSVSVVWGLSETIATFSPIRVLSKVDLPTLERPITATKPDLNFLIHHITFYHFTY